MVTSKRSYMGQRGQVARVVEWSELFLASSPPYFFVLLAVAILLLLTDPDVLFCPPAPILNMLPPTNGGDCTAPNDAGAWACAPKAGSGAPKGGAGAPKAGAGDHTVVSVL